MKLTNQDVIKYINQITAVKEMKINLPGRVGFTMKRNLDRLMAEYKPYAEQLAELKKVHEEKLKEGNEQEEKERYEKEIRELLEAETNVDLIQCPPEPLFEMTIDPAVFDCIDFMLDEGGTE